MQEGKTRWHLSGQSKEQCKHNHRQPLQEWQDEKQESKKQSNLPHLPLFTAACFREETIVAVSTLFAKAAKCLFELNMHRSENKCRPRRSQLKTVGTQKVSPPLFAQHYSCPAVLSCLVGLTMAAFRELFLCGKKYCLNRTGPAQAPPLRSIGKAATSVLPPSSFLSKIISV